MKIENLKTFIYFLLAFTITKHKQNIFSIIYMKMKIHEK
jgi:hypothetical protein